MRRSVGWRRSWGDGQFARGHKDTGKLPVQPFIIKQVGGHRVALIGVTGQPADNAGGLGAKDALEAAREYVPRAQSQTHVVVLLSNVGAEINKAIAEQVPRVDLIGGGGSEPQPGKTPAGRTRLWYTGPPMKLWRPGLPARRETALCA